MWDFRLRTEWRSSAKSPCWVFLPVRLSVSSDSIIVVNPSISSNSRYANKLESSQAYSFPLAGFRFLLSLASRLSSLRHAKHSRILPNSTQLCLSTSVKIGNHALPKPPILTRVKPHEVFDKNRPFPAKNHSFLAKNVKISSKIVTFFLPISLNHYNRYILTPKNKDLQRFLQRKQRSYINSQPPKINTYVNALI